MKQKFDTHVCKTKGISDLERKLYENRSEDVSSVDGYLRTLIPDYDARKKELQEHMAKEGNKGFVDKITDFYFRPKSFERSGKLYEMLGVRYFKKLCAETFRKLVKKVDDSDKIGVPNNYLLWDFSEKGLRAFDNQTRKNEAIHAIPTVAFTIPTVSSISQGSYGMAVLYVGLTFALGIYPILTQRYNRARICNTIDKMEARDSHTSNSF